MKEKLRDYIESVFSDAPDCEKTRELKEEMYQNLCDKYDDLLRDGRSEAAAYNIAISGVGDISDIIDSLKKEYGTDRDRSNPYEEQRKRSLTSEERAQVDRYRVISGIMTSIAVALYILCWVPLVVMTELFGGEANEILGLVIMMLVVAVATGLIILKGAFKPSCMRKGGVAYNGDDDDDYDEIKRTKKRKNPILIAISAVLWPLTVAVYLLVSFSTWQWHITWIIFLISTAVEGIIEAIFEIVGKKYI